ncbi:hypothetical protein EW146_g7217 [Bondarzewia mesenterica]|uniref:MAGE domain-containing protein n=1 Tax=Bondarzewia mesenterica TaxID=1095465 RepID=A0A4S4LS18_9AGAM|nr:hypothetical protein EW146_g7217 [Bondarzewia mesenterica]
MPRAGPSRSQRTTQLSQLQSQSQAGGPSQSQRTRRRATEDEDEEEAGEEEADEEGELDGHGDDDFNKKAHQLVRLALFQEQKRLPLRREDISKKVLGSKRGAFKAVFDAAQNVLRDTFGMELIELPTRATAQETEKERDRGKSGSQQNGADDHRQTITGLKKKVAAQGSKTYILRSTLHSTIIEYAALTDERILEEEAGDAPEFDDDDEVRMYGSIIAWNSSDQLGALGILHVILAIVLVNGRVISDMDLRSSLKRLRLLPSASIPLSAHSTHRSLQLDAYLTQLTRQGYLDRSRLGAPKNNKRGRMTQSQMPSQHDGSDSGESTWEWRWGARAMTEIGEAAVAKFVAEFMAERMGTDDAGSDDDEENGEVARKNAKKRRDEANNRLNALMKGIERAAGGELADVI